MVDMQALANEMQGELLKAERAQALRLTRRYAQSYRRLKTAMQAVTDALESDSPVGQDVMAMPAFRTFLDATVSELNQFGNDAYAEIVGGIKLATEIAVRDAEALMLAPVVDADRETARRLLNPITPEELQKAAGLA